MNDIITGAKIARYTVGEDEMKKQAIKISQAWMAELQKHPYNSSKKLMLILVEKPGTRYWNFLNEGVGKVAQTAKEREKKKLAKRLWLPSEASIEE
jgi:hypothetical protein